MWDTILTSREDSEIHRNGQWNKYMLKDRGYGLRGANVTLRLHYSIMPHMGMLLYGQKGEHRFTMPDAYTGASGDY